jgi:hypothetical protein
MDVGPPVVVVVAEVDAHGRYLLSVLGQRDPGQQRRLLEGAVFAVAEEHARHLVVGHEEVGRAVTVIVPEGDAMPRARQALSFALAVAQSA